MEPTLPIFIFVLLIFILIFILIGYVIVVSRKKKELTNKSLQNNLEQSINAASRDGFLYLDANLKILNFNCYVLQYFRLKEEDLMGKSISNLFEEFNTTDFQLIVEFVATQQQEYEFELFIQEKASWYNLNSLVFSTSIVGVAGFLFSSS